MCGIAGFWNRDTRQPADELSSRARSIVDRLAHRGPDDAGTWVDADVGLGLGHRRLSILDLSAAGHQPMSSATGRFVISYNGEIYNHLDLRQSLEQDTHWRGHSDTETVLACFEKWGIAESLPRFNGMFAMAIWDRNERCLTLTRDRLGIKPLYYGVHQGSLVFGSELKALTHHPDFVREISRPAMTRLCRHGYIPAPLTAFVNTSKLRPGHYLEFRTPGGQVPSRAYWSAVEIADRGRAQPFAGTASEAAEELDRELRKSVQRRMIADVPLGAFLSGGIDSSTIVALMQQLSSEPTKTFSIGFSEADYNESQYAEQVAKHLQTDHTTMIVTPREAQEVIPQLPRLYDEPFADESQIPTTLVSRLARQQVTVSLSGDGGDELFGGYTRFFVAQQRWRRMQRIPQSLRQMWHRNNWLTAALGRPATTLVARSLGRNARADLERLTRTHTFAGSSRSLDLYQQLVTLDPHMLVRGSATSPHEDIWGSEVRRDLPSNEEDAFHEMMLFDSVTYLPDDILVKVDRASMSVGLEARVPILDHEVFAFAWTLPLSIKVVGQTGKHVLRQVLDRYVPASMFDRPKQGFGVPIGAWLKADLRDWAESYLSSECLQRHDLFHVDRVRSMWGEHLQGQGNWSSHLWRVISAQAWADSLS